MLINRDNILEATELLFTGSFIGIRVLPSLLSCFQTQHETKQRQHQLIFVDIMIAFEVKIVGN